MVQGSKKFLPSRPVSLKAKAVKATHKDKKNTNPKFTRKGNPLQLPKRFRDEALDERALSKEIDKANEQKVAAKLLQGGGKVATTDLLQKGKSLNKDIRRSQVKRKLTRVEEKLNELEKKAEQEGLL
eukprot:gene28480-37431_t